MYNKVIMLGRIVQDLELKTTPSGVSVLSFRIAVDRKFQTKGEERKSDFFNCVAWRNEAEFISRYWTKGRPILVEGELQNRSYTGNDGVVRYITEIVVDRATFTGDKAPSSSGYSAGNYPPPPPPVQQSSQPTQHPAEQTNSAPTAANGSYTASDFVETTNTDDDYPF